MTEDVNGHQLLIGKGWLAIIARALIFQVWAFIVSLADPQIEFDELVFHKLNSTTLLVDLLFYFCFA